MRYPWARWMIFFVASFYGFLFFSQIFTSKAQDRQIRIAEKEQVVSDLKAKEKEVLSRISEKPQLVQILSFGFFVMLMTGLYLDARFAASVTKGTAWIFKSQSFPDVMWTEKDVFMVFIFLLFAEAFLFFIHSSLHFFGYESIPDALFILMSFFRSAAVAMFMFWIVKKGCRQGFAELGFKNQHLWADIKTGATAYVAVIPPLLVCFVATAFIVRLFALEPEPQQVVQLYLKDSTHPFLMGLTLFVAILGPVMEEFLFRGYAYAGLRKKYGIWPSAILCSGIFAALHMHWAALVPIFFLGMFLTMLYEFSGSIIPSITAHVIHNTLMVAAMLGFKSLSS